MGVTCRNSISRALVYIDLAAAVNTRNLEGMRTFDVQAMVRGYHVTFGMHRSTSKATSVFAADMAREGTS